MGYTSEIACKTRRACLVVVGSGLTLAVTVLVVGLLAKLGGLFVSTTGAGLSLTVVVPVGFFRN